MATYAKEATADEGTPRPSPSVPEAGSSIADRGTRVGYRCLVLGSTPISAGHPDCPRGASGEICSQRRTQRVERTGLSMVAAAHRVAVAVVEGLPWVPDRPTLGSRFSFGLCQVPAHKTVSAGFPRVFRFPQLLL